MNRDEPNIGRIGLIVALIVVVLTAWYLIVHGQGKSADVNNSPAQTSRPSATAASSPTISVGAIPKLSEKPSPETNASASVAASSALPTPSDPVVPPAVISQMADFIQAYYLVLPTDTAASRNQRMSQLRPSVPPSVLASLKLTGSPALVVEQGLTLSGKLDLSKVKAMTVNRHAGELYLIADVIKTVARKDGTVAQTSTKKTASQWRSVSGRWSIMFFSEEGDTP